MISPAVEEILAIRKELGIGLKEAKRFVMLNRLEDAIDESESLAQQQDVKDILKSIVELL